MFFLLMLLIAMVSASGAGAGRVGARADVCYVVTCVDTVLTGDVWTKGSYPRGHVIMPR